MKARLAAPAPGSSGPRAAGSATVPRLASVIGNRAMAAAAAGTTAPIRPPLSPAAVQRKLSIGRAPGGTGSHPARADSAQVHAIAAHGTTTPATRLPYADQIQRAFGQHDISGIQAHTGQEAAASAREMGARAYATGGHVVLDRGTDLHTVAHEAAHVIQQRAGVNLSGGVGRAGDPYEQHADAVADMVVQGRSAESHLAQYAGGSQAGGAVVQRASDYAGILPKHETFEDSYRFQGRRSTDFTYHHIIPENKLEKVYKQLRTIRDYLEGDGPSNKTSNAFNAQLSGLVTNARKGWLKTRARNTTYALQQDFGDLPVQIPESKVEEILKAYAQTQDDPSGAFQSQYKQELEPNFHEAKRKARSTVSTMLNTTSFFRTGWGDERLIRELWEALGKDVYNFDILAPWLQDALQAVRDEDEQHRITSKVLDKRSVLKHIKFALQRYDLETYFRDKFPALSALRPTQGTLKKLLQQNAIPHEDSEHLEHAVQWNPGNIHRGPASSKRLNPDAGEEFDALVDDGGDNFEKAAANLVERKHYEVLEELNEQIDGFLKVPIRNGVPDDNKIAAAVEIVRRMRALMEFGLTKFDEHQWEQKGDKHMRLRKNNTNLRAVGLIP